MKVLLFLLFLVLAGCTQSKLVIEGDALSDKKSFEAKTGFLSVVSAESACDAKEVCQKKNGTLILSGDSLKAAVPFHPNQVFAAPLPPGYYEIDSIAYFCEGSDAHSKFSWGFDGMPDKRLYLKIPHEGFCKMDILAASELSLVPGKQEIEAKRPYGSLAVNLEKLPDCLIYSDDVLYKEKLIVSGQSSCLNSEDFVWKNIGGTAKLNTEKAGKVSVSYSDDAVASKPNVVAEMKQKKDLSTCSVLSYSYRGAGHAFFATTSLLGGSFVTVPVLIKDSEDWRQVTVPWNNPNVAGEVSMEEFRKSLIGLTWRIEGYSSVGNYLEIKNVRCE